MPTRRASGAAPFDTDVSERGGYKYTTEAPLSSQLANERLTQATLDLLDGSARRVLDFGCGDGTYTAAIATRSGAREVVGIDPALEAITVASERYATLENVSFRHGAEGDLAALGHFDRAVARGVLHHAEDPAGVLAALASVTDELVLLEPNGYAPALKVIERASRYHREHGERSFRPSLLRRWLASAGFSLQAEGYVGLVPFFAPARAARALKRLEPSVERSPLGPLACAVYVVRAASRREVGGPAREL